jgi:hypothetical protein
MYPLGFLQVPIKKLPIAERYGGDHPTTRCSADQLHVSAGTCLQGAIKKAAEDKDLTSCLQSCIRLCTQILISTYTSNLLLVA